MGLLRVKTGQRDRTPGESRLTDGGSRPRRVEVDLENSDSWTEISSQR